MKNLTPFFLALSVFLFAGSVRVSASVLHDTTSENLSILTQFCIDDEQPDQAWLTPVSNSFIGLGFFLGGGTETNVEEYEVAFVKKCIHTGCFVISLLCVALLSFLLFLKKRATFAVHSSLVNPERSYILFRVIRI